MTSEKWSQYIKSVLYPSHSSLTHIYIQLHQVIVTIEFIFDFKSVSGRLIQYLSVQIMLCIYIYIHILRND